MINLVKQTLMSFHTKYQYCEDIFWLNLDQDTFTLIYMSESSTQTGPYPKTLMVVEDICKVFTNKMNAIFGYIKA